MLSIRVPVHSTCAPPARTSDAAPPVTVAAPPTTPSFMCDVTLNANSTDALLRSVCASRNVVVKTGAPSGVVKTLHNLVLEYTPSAYVLPSSVASIKDELLNRGPLLFTLGATPQFAHFWSEVAEGKVSGDGVFTHTLVSTKHARVWVVAALLGWTPRGWRILVPWTPLDQLVTVQFQCGLERTVVGVGPLPPGAVSLPLPLPLVDAKKKKRTIRGSVTPAVAKRTTAARLDDVWNSALVELGVVWLTVVALCALYLHTVFSRARK